MTMQSNCAFNLNAAGQPFQVPNPLLNGTSISATYTLAYQTAPSGNVTVTVEGFSNASGDTAVLDSVSFSATSPQSRTINLSATYDYFTVTATWSGGVNVSVAVVISSAIGTGPTFVNTVLPTIHTV